MEKVLAVIVTYNGMKWIDRCVGSIRNSSVDADIYIIDNASTDGTTQYLKDRYPDIKLMESTINMGFTRANNIGMRYAMENNYQYVYLMNQDAWVEEDTIEKLINANKRHPEFGLLSPVQMNAECTKIDRNFKKWYDIKTPTADKDIYEMKMCMAAHWLLSAECIRTVGVFSPTFTHYGEDDNYIDRVFYHKMRCGVVESAKAVHDREYRDDSAGKNAYIYYTSFLTVLSDPNDNLARCMISQPIRLLRKMPRLCSKADTVKFLIRLIGSYPSIIANRSKSKKKGAFL